VLPFLQGRGIGTQLIEAAETELVERGFLAATIAVAVENERARALYERLGYEVFRRDTSSWSYHDPDGNTHEVNEICWALKKPLVEEDDLHYDL
jgi:ribosomal protein S18 acetylase RimI-like enzyme